MVNRTVVGAHYGLRDWLAQRITSVVMVAYVVIVLFYLLSHRAPDYAAWKALFQPQWLRVLTMLFFVSLCWHAWIGARDIWMDYIKPTSVRLTLQVLTVIALAVYVIWAAAILWGA